MEHKTTAVWIDTGTPMIAFLCESLAIEGIHRDPTPEEVDATRTFLRGETSVDAVIELQRVYAPGMPLRDRPGMDVRIGRHIPMRGNQYMRDHLERVLNNNTDPYQIHVAFEILHPFMDGNGRTGRAVWASAMIESGQHPFALSFLHRFYYQTLDHADGR